MQQFIRYLSFTLLGLALGLSVTLSSQENTEQLHSRLNYPLLLDIIDTVETYYVTKFSRDELITAAIEGIFAHLDPYSNFLDKQDFSNIREANKGEYFGFGVEIASEDEKITIITPFENSPADHAGIKPGDQILKLNNKPVDPKKLEQLLKEIKHHSRNRLSIALTLLHPSAGTVFEVTLIPTTISIQSVSTKIIENKIGYIRLTSFQDNSTEDMLKQLAQWQQIKLTGIILDLRNNPGGLLDQAIKIADIFLAKGKIVSTEGRFFDANSEYYASPKTMFANVPMTILINKGSASASEVLAAALQENNRAQIIGETSFGKGTVQSLIPTLIEGHAIKLTIAKYTTPNGRNIDSKGIEPDIKLNLDTITNNKSMTIIKELEIQGEDTQDKILDSAITWIKTKK
ncbi:S41 family peptidase [Shewanella sp. VB17]|uniref:S41 family peptidase n=1 Tax=Shewanella sp. VB17 TaxID=2739432 RepID=UPI0015657BF2|nr:S41 family peptidase [Shewanella sp. VB17]NRD71822.1 S41 family peptidase [Shewanella sp. VB17]